MESVITGLVSRFGYWGVLLLIAVENIFPPIPSEVILTFGGFLTTCTEMTPPGVILFSTLGSVAGAIVLYGVGRLLAPQRLEALLSGRVGRVLKMESADVHKASDWFAAHGWPSVFYCRCIPILRSLISIPAGMAGMHPAPFLLLTTVGSLLWNILLVYLGALAGQSWPAVTAALEQAANSLPADVDARSLSRYAQQLENARYAQELETSARQGAGEASILHNAASVAANAWNLPAALDYAKQWARNTFTGDYAPIDVNTPAQTMNIYRDAVRDETGRNIEEGLGGGLAGKAASFVYQTGMSWADSLANMAMSGGNPYLSGVLMGSGTMTSTVRSAKEKGASDSQAMGAGVAAGIFEGLFEQYSIENLSWMAKSDPRTFLDVVKNLGKSILGEGSEELFTELANAAADTLIMGDLSDYNLAVRQYKAQGESEEEARRHAGWDVAKQAGLAFAGGGLMGFGSAAGGMAYNGAANRYAAPRAVESGSFYNALQYGLAQGEDTAAGRLARELAGRDTASRADVMRMLRAAESRQAEGGPGAQTLVDPQLYTRAEVQGMSAGEVRENYDAIQESMRRGFAVGAPARRSRDGNGKIAAPVGPVTGRAVSRSEMEADLRPTSAFGTKTGSCCKARRRRRRRRKATPKISKWTWKTPR